MLCVCRGEKANSGSRTVRSKTLSADLRHWGSSPDLSPPHVMPLSHRQLLPPADTRTNWRSAHSKKKGPYRAGVSLPPPLKDKLGNAGGGERPASSSHIPQPPFCLLQ